MPRDGTSMRNFATQLFSEKLKESRSDTLAMGMNRAVWAAPATPPESASPPISFNRSSCRLCDLRVRSSSCCRMNRSSARVVRTAGCRGTKPAAPRPIPFVEPLPSSAAAKSSGCSLYAMTSAMTCLHTPRNRPYAGHVHDDWPTLPASVSIAAETR